ncbi:MAG TPA: sodium:solute symporter family protein [Aquabacterium sp.]|uniref:sodium:solute symporter family protein n=1 Tax=Aquabacterium sp. TaxID=1872578 RepID=UPI002E33BFD6|nr:sodium:solute symporter family protein [Aquabacterium sp.]HEX5374019.1 sodium:solute symporter family protein [Aquabacterium sp.]
MNTTLLAFVIAYLLATMALGIYAGTRIKSTADFAIAGRSLPLAMVITTTFATWFGAETVMGIPAKFVSGGLNAVIEDPFGASMCLVLVGAFFASRLYKMSLLTIGDYYRQRYGKGVEIFCSIAIILSYLGWVAAQITALGLVFSVLSGGEISANVGMIIGTVLVLVYVLIGGMLAVAWTDFVQMIVLVVGLSLIAVLASEQAGGAGQVIALAEAQNWFKILPESTVDGWIWFVAAAITMMFGSIPQQDVFQRVMSAKDGATATRGAIIGGFSYLAFAFVPMFIVASALIIMPTETKDLLANDPQKVLPTLILTKMPLVAQIFFFGALVSAIKSTSSATLLAPSTSFVENILKNLHPGMSDRQVLLAMRITIFVFTALVLTYAMAMQGTSIYDLVSAAYQVPLVGAFVPLTFGLYWSRATTQGAVLSIVLGIGTLVLFTFHGPLGEAFPGQLAGLITALFGMVAGSLGPQFIADHRTRIAHMT